MPVAREGRGLPQSANQISLHEAIVSPPIDREPDRVGNSPPAPIVERPGVSPPSPDARWIEGYWEWDGGRQDFVWVTGTWRVPPPGKFWVNGFWRRDDRGWYRVPGFWCARQEAPAADASPAPPPRASAPAGATRPEASSPIGRTDPARMAPPAATTTHTVARPPLEAPRSAGGRDPGLAAARAASDDLAPPAAAPVSPVAVPAPTAFAPPPRVVALADRLAGQAAAFEQVFGMTAGVTPQGGAFLADARRLRGAALGLHQAATAGDASRAALAYRDIYSTWRRMADRASRIAPGRAGPNIQQIWRMGDTAAQIGRVMP
ncbi:MAG TPA: hypothetical protein VKP69_30190 [Isosphaeraceae bacterium]|nr:hypothetical protein [Isosphaeraceae bacterium]